MLNEWCPLGEILSYNVERIGASTRLEGEAAEATRGVEAATRRGHGNIILEGADSELVVKAAKSFPTHTEWRRIQIQVTELH